MKIRNIEAREYELRRQWEDSLSPEEWDEHFGEPSFRWYPEDEEYEALGN